MVLRHIVILAATAGFSATEAAAPQTLSFNCDAVPGEVSAMDANHLAAATTISGNLRAVEVRQDNNLQPAATVKLASRKDFVALQLAPTKPNSGKFVVFVRNGDAKEEERTLLGEVTLNEPMPFRVAQSGKDVIVVAAGHTLSVRQSFRGPPSMGVSCSTGHFQFDNVSVQ
ncbi:hypothetical protein [Sphingomonas sp. URHD0057]|uniref:hypothetical protein n=1 Tax=Sphingomonas sp. URHD0057 TaxID=1380389 RepID=UPI00048EF891|nr:hypothetical protein [Sphingomonas sp. URHD0057]